MSKFMTNTEQKFVLNLDLALARKVIAEQFQEFAHMPISEVEKQGHDNRTYRLGSEMLIRMPTAESYALKVPKEQELLPKLAPYLGISIPVPIKMGVPSNSYPYPFSIYQWIPGTSLNLLRISSEKMEQLALDLARFLKELQSITEIDGPSPGQHNWWRGDHISVYDKEAREQLAKLADIINSDAAFNVWEQACATKWDKPSVWVHGDFAVGNFLLDKDKLSAIVDFGGVAMGDPACDLVIAWTYLENKARDIFIKEMELDKNTWLRARAWALWKATFQLCQIGDKKSVEAEFQKKIIDEVSRHQTL